MKELDAVISVIDYHVKKLVTFSNRLQDKPLFFKNGSNPLPAVKVIAYFSVSKNFVPTLFMSLKSSTASIIL